MLKVIFLDIDNTLLSFDEYVKNAMRNGFARFGLKPYEEGMFEIFEEFNNGLWQNLEKGLLTFADIEKNRWNIIFRELGISFDGPRFEKYFRKELQDSAILEPGARELLQRLSGNYILCAASNGPYEQQVHRMKLGDLYDFFSYFFVSEDIGASKPSTAFFEESFRRLNEGRNPVILPEETLILGDSLTSDMAGGRAYGMQTCYYNRRNRMLPEGCQVDSVIRSLEEFLP